MFSDAAVSAAAAEADLAAASEVAGAISAGAAETLAAADSIGAAADLIAAILAAAIGISPIAAAISGPIDSAGTADDRYGNWGGDRGNFGDRGAGDRNWQSAFDGTRFATTAAWDGSPRSMRITARAIGRRATLPIAPVPCAITSDTTTAFNHDWYAAHPGCWFAAGWAAGAAWTWATWPVMSAWCAFPGPPAYYDYGSNIVYQDDTVYYDGNPVCTAQQYAQQATTLADQGQTADAPDSDQWQPLGVFSLVQGDETTSNNLFQLAVNKQGIIRGNYYDGLMDTTTPVYGSVDKKNQRAAWTIGKKNDRVFETGIYNLTKPEAPVLVHFGGDRRSSGCWCGSKISSRTLRPGPSRIYPPVTAVQAEKVVSRRICKVGQVDCPCVIRGWAFRHSADSLNIYLVGWELS